MEKQRILYAHPISTRRHRYQRLLSRLGYDVTVVENGLQCLSEFRALRPDILILDPHILWGGSQGVVRVLRDEGHLEGTRVLCNPGPLTNQLVEIPAWFPATVESPFDVLA